MMTETPREIAHGKVKDILRKHKSFDSAIVAELMPIMDDYAAARFSEAMDYSANLARTIHGGLNTMTHTAEDIMKHLNNAAAKGKIP